MSITYDQLSVALQRIAEVKSEWAGIPMPLPDLDLVLEPKYPFKGLGEFNREPGEKDPDEGCTEVNTWWSTRLRRQVLLWRDPDGKLKWGAIPHNWTRPLIQTIGAVIAWPMESEWRALDKLRAIVGDYKIKCYEMTGTFLETSPRSGITYLFRRLRPTLAFSTQGGATRILCGLCLHSIGFYAGTHAGCLCPTDEVISHIVQIRADEHYFWRQANQHPPDSPYL